MIANIVAFMNQQEIIASLEARARNVRLPMAEACKRAGIHPTTFSRWKLSDKNSTPKGATITSVERLDQVIAQAELAAAKAEKAA